MSRLDINVGDGSSVVMEDAKRHLSEAPLKEFIFLDGAFNPEWPMIKLQDKTLTFWWFQQAADEQRALLKEISQSAKKEQILLTIKILSAPNWEANPDEVIRRAALLFLLHRELKQDNFYDQLMTFFCIKNSNVMIRASQMVEFLKNTCDGKPTGSVNTVELRFLLHLLSLIANASLDSIKPYSLFEKRSNDRIYQAASKLILEVNRGDLIMLLLTINPTLTAWVLNRFEKNKSEIPAKIIFEAMRIIFKAETPSSKKSVHCMLSLCFQFLDHKISDELRPYEKEFLLMQKYVEESQTMDSGQNKTNLSVAPFK